LFARLPRDDRCVSASRVRLYFYSVCVRVTGDTRDIELLLFNDDDFRKRKIVLNSYGDGTVPIHIIYEGG